MLNEGKGLNVLIYGLGSIAKKHIEALRSLTGSQLRLYALRSRATHHKADGVTDIFEEKELPAPPDMIIISNPTSLRSETIKRALQFNKPLFIEKPGLFSLVDAQPVSDLIKAKSILTYVACNLRFHPCLSFLKHQLDTSHDKVEEVNIYCGSYLPEWRPTVSDFKDSYSARPGLGGGVHLDLIHELDYFYWLFGPADVLSVVKRNRSSLGIDAMDYAHFVLDHQDFVASITLNYFRRVKKRQIEIVTSTGIWVADLVSNTVHFNDEQVVSFPDFNIMDTYLSQMKYFLDNFQGSEPMMNSLEESIPVLKIALA